MPNYVPPRRSPWRGIAALAATLAIGGSVAWWFGLRGERPAGSYGAVKPLTTYSGIEREPSLSPDGNQVAFVWNGPDRDNFDI